MSEQLTVEERTAILVGAGHFVPRAKLVDGRFERYRWSETKELQPIPAAQRLEVTHNAEELATARANAVVALTTPSAPWDTDARRAVTAGTHRVEAMTALAQELIAIVNATTEDGAAQAEVTFDDLEAWLLRKSQSLNENISKQQQRTISPLESPRERWVEDLTDDNGKPWVRISDRVLDDLARLACSQGAALLATTTAPRLLTHTVTTLADPGRREVRTYRTNQALTVPYTRVEVPRGQPLMLPFGDGEEERIEGTSIPLHRALVKPADPRTLLWLSYEWVERPRDEHGERLDFFELNATRILGRWGYGTRGSARTDFLESVERLAEFRVDAASTGGRERWVVDGPGENAPRLLQITKCEVDGREVPNKPRRARFAPPVADALHDVRQAIQIRTESLRHDPSTVLVHLGLAGLIRDRITETFDNLRETEQAAFVLASADEFVRWCNRETRALHDGVPLHFRRLSELASDGYVEATIRPDGSVLCVVDDLWLDVYRPFEDAKQRHTVESVLAKKRGRARKRLL